MTTKQGADPRLHNTNHLREALSTRNCGGTYLRLPRDSVKSILIGLKKVALTGPVLYGIRRSDPAKTKKTLAL
jgi:hypothetical protein